MSRLFINRPIFAWVLAIIVMLGGIGALWSLPIEQYPDIAPAQVNIRASYPGASAEAIETSVTQILEQQLTGIDGLLPDPHMTGGGLHQYLPGAELRVHADFNKLPGYGLDRRLNLLLYLNPAWDEAWGGALELWDRDMQACVQRIAPVANRCVVFSTTRDSYHGMPDPLRCPDGVTRRSLALYYYSNGRPQHERGPDHSTLWQTRPGEA